MKIVAAHPLCILCMIILASVLLVASVEPQLATPAPEANADATGETDLQPTMGNPAAVYCTDLGYEYEIVDEEGQRGLCALPDGQVCDAWEFLQGKCGQSYSYCAQQGYELETASDGQDPFSPEYAVCVTSEGKVIGSVSELSALSEKATGCGGEIPDQATAPTPDEGNEYSPSSPEAPPASFDWRSYLGSDWLSPIKSQGGCGSCWAFSAVGVTEAAHNIATNNPNLDLDISEQYLVADCSSSGTCCGGWKTSALQFIQDLGVPDEACMTYVDGTGCSCPGGLCSSGCSYRTGGSCSDRTCSYRCGDWASRLTYINSIGYVGTNPQTIKQALVDTGPLAVSMGIESEFGGYWDGDIYRCTNDTGTNHAVVIVGYSDAGGYWWVRNSWGTGWGDGGYFKLGYGECRVEGSVYYAEVVSSSLGPLEHHSHAIDDDLSGNSNGNGDGIVDCGETIELYVDLLNQGANAATGVSASISTSDPYVTWLHNTSSGYPNIAGGGTGTNLDDFDFAVDPATPNGHVIQFDLDITASNGGPWSDSFDVPVTCSAPVCNALSLGYSGPGSTPTASPPNSSGCPSGQYLAGESITLTPYPAAGYHLGYWEGTDASTSNHLTMPANSHSVSAHYAANGPIPVAVYDHAGTGDISYFTGTNANYWMHYATLLESDPAGRFGVTVITDLSAATLSGYDRLVLPDNAVPDADLVTVDAWFGAGKRIVAVDSATTYAAFSGYLWPGSAGSNGHGTLWDYGSSANDQLILLADKITEDYGVGDVLYSRAGHAQLFAGTLPADAIAPTAKQSDTSMIYVAYRPVPGQGTMVVLGPFIPSDATVYDLVRDAVEGPGGDPYEPDNTWDQASWIDNGSPQTHSIVPVGDVDWVKFSLGADSEVVIETSGTSGDTRIWLYDSNLDELEFNDDGGSNRFSLIDRLCGVDALPAGEYYVRVDDYGNNDEIPSYDITFTVLKICGYDHMIYLPVVQRNH